MEPLEERALLATTLYLDFGGGIGIGNTLSTTMGAFRNVDGVGLHGNGTGSNLIGRNGLQSTSSLDMRPLSYDFNGDSLVNNSDITALANAVVPIVQRALEPFDIIVQVASAVSLTDVVNTLNVNNGSSTGEFDAYSFVIAAYSNFFGGGSVGDNAATGFDDGYSDETSDGTNLFGIAAADDLFSQTGNNQDEATLTFSDTILGATTGTPGSAAFNKNLAHRLAFTATHEAFHTLTYAHTFGAGSDGDVIRTGASSLARENPFIVTRFDLQHQAIGGPIAEPNNYLLAANDPDIGLRDDDRDGRPNLAYVTGTGAFDKITLDRDATNPNLVHVTVAAHNNATFTSLIAQETFDINLTTDTEGEILIDSSLSSDLIEIDADIAASVQIRGMLGDDQVKLRGVGASALQGFVFDGEGGNDTFTIDYQNGDPLPLPGFNFNFIGGDGTDNTAVIEVGGAQRTGFFVSTLTDAADISVGNGRADSNAAADDQTTLRSAIQEGNFAANRTYVFLPTGAYSLSVTGTGGDTQGDLDISKSITVIGTGAGEAIINASSFGTASDRVFDLANQGVLDLSRVTLTGGKAPNAVGEHGGAIIVRNGGTLNLNDSTLVSNQTTHSGANGGAIHFWPGGGGTITNSVITANHSSNFTGGVILGAHTVAAPVTLTGTVVANNTAVQAAGKDVYGATGVQGFPRPFTSGGNNRLTSGGQGFTPLASDYIGPANYVVTGVADTYDGTTDIVVMSIRDAIRQANITSGAQEIWVPGWKSTLTRERNFATQLTDTDVSFGDLDIDDTLTLRGVTGSTSVAWRAGAAVDKVFELLGDYNNDNSVDGADFVLWQATLGSTTNLAADGDDDGVVDGDDYNVWSANFGNTLTRLGV